MGRMEKMKGKRLEIKRCAVHDGDGIRTTVFFKGCPLKCVWCHNPEGISPQSELAYFVQKCIHCGECLSVCPMGAHIMDNGKHIFYRDRCVACGKCAEACLGNALAFYGKEYTVEELLPILLKDKDFYKDDIAKIQQLISEIFLNTFAFLLTYALRADVRYSTSNSTHILISCAGTGEAILVSSLNLPAMRFAVGLAAATYSILPP